MAFCGILMKSLKSSFSRYFMVSGFYYLRILKITFGKKSTSLLNIKLTYAPKNIVQKYFLLSVKYLVCMYIRQMLAYIELLGKH